MFAITFFFSFARGEQKIMSAVYDPVSKKFSFPATYDAKAAARAIFSNDQNKTGWYNLQIEGDRITDNEIESRAAGILEGRLTHELFKFHRKNVYAHLCDTYINCEGGKIPAGISNFFVNNYNWVKEHTSNNMNNDDPFYFHAKMLVAQIEGIVEGFNIENPEPANQMTVPQLWEFMSHAMIYDLAKTKGLNFSKENSPLISRRGTALVGHSAAPDNVFIGQTAWRSYGESIRIAKRYRLRFNSSFQVVDRRALSSYPFMLHSDDEFTLSDEGLAIVSSSIPISKSFMKSIKYQTQGYPYWFRNIVATEASHSCDDWLRNYQPMPSTGTGIEYLIVDIKKFKYKESYQDEFIFVVDEIPNKVVGQDVTSVYKAKSFFGSYDIPYISEIYNDLGFATLASQDPNWFDYSESVRARIMQQKAQTIFDDAKMKSLMRLNSPSTVTQQNNSAVNAIAGRLELDEPANRRCFGAFDAKYTTIPRMLHMQWVGEVGASRDDKDLPALNLDLSTTCQPESHEGVDPNMYNKWADQYFDIELQ